jgi:hypothetical protein
MDWLQITEGWKQLIAKVASPRSAAQEIDSQANHSILAALSGGDGYDEAGIAPYVPDNHSERNNYSLHLSC